MKSKQKMPTREINQDGSTGQEKYQRRKKDYGMKLRQDPREDGKTWLPDNALKTENSLEKKNNFKPIIHITILTNNSTIMLV